jgi:hypothetical protein
VTGPLQRLRGAWGGIDRDQRFAGIAATALLFTMFLPWYEKNAFDSESKRFVTDSVSAFGVVSFVEAAIFLVAAGVLVLVLARGERRTFQLPGGDGSVIFAAGLWATLLIFYRVFDRPQVSGQAGTVGIQWGFFAAFVAAGALALAGQRMRAASRPEPPARADDEPASGGAQERTEVAADAASGGAQERTEVAADAASDGAEERTEVAADARSERRTEVVPAAEAPTNVAPRRRPSSRAVTREDAEQLTFDEPPEPLPPPPLRPGEVPPARERR